MNVKQQKIEDTVNGYFVLAQLTDKQLTLASWTTDDGEVPLVAHRSNALSLQRLSKFPAADGYRVYALRSTAIGDVALQEVNQDNLESTIEVLLSDKVAACLSRHQEAAVIKAILRQDRWSRPALHGLEATTWREELDGHVRSSVVRHGA